MKPQPSIEDLLAEKLGVAIETMGADTIAAVIRRRMSAQKITDQQEYARYLTTSPEEWQELLEAVVVPETWFFRNLESFLFLGQYIRTEWLTKGSRGVLRVLSMPCSTGEEPYSIAMTLLEAGLPHDRFSIAAVDISAKALHKAQQGIYGSESFRGQESLAYRERYFTTAAGHRIDAALRNTVCFIRGNLLDSQLLAGTQPYDVIFCRNLLIYFRSPARQKITHLVEHLISPDGLLFVGHVERGFFNLAGFVSVTMPGVFAYYRSGKLDEARIRTPEQPPRFERRKTERVDLLNPPLKAAPAAPPISAPRPRVIERRQTSDETIKTLDSARALADQGKLVEALQHCDAVLAHNAVHVQAYFLKGLIHHALKDEHQAEEYFNKTLYLDPNHDEALYYLSLMMEDRGEHDLAQHVRQRIQRIYQRQGKPGRTF